MTPFQQSYRQIPLSQGQFAIVDESDYEWLTQWRWTARWNPHTKSFYASRHDEESPKRILIHMHRIILGLHPEDARKGDHVNHDTLDNRRQNLRIADNLQNGSNARKRFDNTSGYKGVHYRHDLGRWTARIGVNRKRIHLGHFITPELAHKAYAEASRKFHGEFGLAE